MTNFGEHVSFIWSIAEILRGNYKQSEYLHRSHALRGNASEDAQRQLTRRRAP